MPRSSIHRPRLASLSVLALALVLQSCSSVTDAGGNTSAAAFVLTLGAPSVSLTPGGTASTVIRATRTGGLTSAITYAVAGAPAGLTAALVNTSVPDSSTFTIGAAVTVAAGAYPIVVNATAPGAPPQHATLTIVVQPGGPPAIRMVTAGAHTCALTTAGAAYCWGYNGDGQLGNNDSSLVTSTPVAVAGGLTFQSVATSQVEGVSCGITTSGAAYCWGDNSGGQLGDGTKTRRLTPTPVAGGLTFKSLAVGNNGHACGVATNGSAFCWGTSPNGAFGDGSTGVHLTPTAAAPGLSFQSIAAGTDYTCGLTTLGAAYCWGFGLSGQLGNGNIGSTTTPIAVAGGLTFRSLVAGGLTVCGLTTPGKAYCWGYNFYGTVGDGSSATQGGPTRRAAPVEVAGGLTFQSLSAGYLTTCGVTDTGAGYCWGYNVGAVGDGTDDHRATPVAVAGGLKFQSISGGPGYSCGVTTSNAVYCWGSNDNGELGDGTVGAHTLPVPVRWP